MHDCTTAFATVLIKEFYYYAYYYYNYYYYDYQGRF